MQNKRLWHTFFFGGGVLFLSFVLYSTWPQVLIDAGYMRLHSLDGIRYTQGNVIDVQDFKHFDTGVQILHLRDGSRWFAHDGYVSLAFAPDASNATVSESIIGLAPYLFSKNTHNAFTIGVASGVSAGVLGMLYDHTHAVDINPATLEALDEFRENNLAVHENPRVTFEVQDGVLALLARDTTYDVILNSVPSPTYYSASKLWSEDVLMLIRSRLSPGGVYSGWFDTRLTEEGVRLTLQTYKNVFAHCAYIPITPSYFNILCSDEPLVLARGVDDDALPGEVVAQFDPLTRDTAISTVLHESMVALWPEVPFAQEGAVHTLNHPRLEFTASPLFVQTAQTRTYIQKLARVGLISFSSEKTQEERCRGVSILLPEWYVYETFPYCISDLLLK